MTTPNLLTPQEVADILKISYRKTLDLVKQKKIKAYEVAGQYRINKGDLDSYLKERVK